MKVKFLLMVFGIIILFSFVSGVSFDFGEGIGDSDSTSFDTGGGAPQCFANDTYARWDFSSGDSYLIVINGSSVDEILAGEGCYQEDGIPGRSCCPRGYVCNQTTEKCELTSQPDPILSSCSKFDNTSEDECRGANIRNMEEAIYDKFLRNLESSGVSDSEIPKESDLHFCTQAQKFTIGGEDLIFGNCGCEWNSSSKECFESYKNTPYSPPSPDPIYKCETKDTSLEDLCDEKDIYRLSWTAKRYKIEGGNQEEVDLSEDCNSGEADFPCPEVAVEPFFSFVNFVIAGFLTLIFYFLFFKKFE